MVERYARSSLPLSIRYSVQTYTLAERVDIENILPTPRRRVEIILKAAHPPLEITGHRISRYAAQKPCCLVDLTHNLDTLDQNFATFFSRMEEPYGSWRKYTYEEEKAYKALKRKALTQQILGGLAILGAALGPRAARPSPEPVL